jgi:hypothetical protein
MCPALGENWKSTPRFPEKGMKSFEMLLLKIAQRCRDPTTVILKWRSCDSLLKDAEDDIH